MYNTRPHDGWCEATSFIQSYCDLPKMALYEEYASMTAFEI